LAKALASVLSARWGFTIATQVDAYRIALIAPALIDPEAVKRELADLKPEELEPLLMSILGNTSLLGWRLWNVAKRFGLVGRQAEYKTSRGKILTKALWRTPIYEEALREIFIEKMDFNCPFDTIFNNISAKLGYYYTNLLAPFFIKSKFFYDTDYFISCIHRISIFFDSEFY